MSRLKAFFSYKKFQQEQLRIVFLNKNYFLQEESIRDLRRLGHQVIPVEIIENNPKQMLDKLLKTCLEVKPDFILGTNHLGFDPEGKIANVLAELEIPVAFWYLDDYRFIIPEAEDQAFPNICIFTFEQNDLPDLKQAGFINVFYLPSGSTLLPGTNYKDQNYNYLASRVSFVGNTFIDAQKRWLREGYEVLYNQIDFSNWNISTNSLVEYISQQNISPFQNKAELYHFAGYAAGRHTMEQRIKVLNQIDNPIIFGDSYWKKLGVKAEVYPPVHIIQQAPSVYLASLINLNISSSQLTTSVNLRVFDVPLAGGFLLTDWRESLAELFDVESELAIYHNKDELLDKIDFFKKNPQKRQAIIQSAAQRIETEHLLIHRMQKIIVQLRKVFS